MGSADVTRRAITLGSRESTTGWRAVTWTTSTIEMVILPRGSSLLRLFPGSYAVHDYVGFTDDTVVEGDQILDGASRYFDVETVAPIYMLDSFVYRECQLAELPIWQASPGTLTWSKTRPEDPRERSKVYVDTYVRDAQITKDDDSTQATWACIFSEPPYPVAQEFRATSTPVFGLYVVEMPNSTPKIDHGLEAYGYTEHVPTHIMTVDSTACTGTALNWKMEAELRYVCEQNPTGSYWLPRESRKLDRNLGGMMLYDRLFTLTYERDNS